MSWDIYSPESHIEQVGAILSSHIHCPIHLLGGFHLKPMFECYCDKTFALYAVEGAIRNNNWSLIEKRHQGLV